MFLPAIWRATVLGSTNRAENDGTIAFLLTAELPTDVSTDFHRDGKRGRMVV